MQLSKLAEIQKADTKAPQLDANSLGLSTGRLGIGGTHPTVPAKSIGCPNLRAKLTAVSYHVATTTAERQSASKMQSFVVAGRRFDS